MVPEEAALWEGVNDRLAITVSYTDRVIKSARAILGADDPETRAAMLREQPCMQTNRLQATVP